MTKFLHKINKHENYIKNVTEDHKFNITLCKDEYHLHYDKYIIPHYNLFDILYANSNGEKKVDSAILDPSLGYVPIGICVAETNFFGANEKARFISLKYMSGETPDTGGYSGWWLNWGNKEVNLEGMPLYFSNFVKDYIDGQSIKVHGANNQVDFECPSVIDNSGKWNLSELGEKNQYALTDVDGKQHTEILLNYATGQENWRTDQTITKSGDSGYSPAACCCWRYHTLGTQQGDWYLPAAGEFLMFAEKHDEFITKLQLLKSQYNDYIINDFNYGYLWSSTALNNGAALRFVNYEIQSKHRADDDNVYAFIQY